MFGSSSGQPHLADAAGQRRERSPKLWFTAWNASANFCLDTASISWIAFSVSRIGVVALLRLLELPCAHPSLAQLEVSVRHSLLSAEAYNMVPGRDPQTG